MFEQLAMIFWLTIMPSSVHIQGLGTTDCPPEITEAILFGENEILLNIQTAQLPCNDERMRWNFDIPLGNVNAVHMYVNGEYVETKRVVQRMYYPLIFGAKTNNDFSRTNSSDLLDNFSNSVSGNSPGTWQLYADHSTFGHTP